MGLGNGQLHDVLSALHGDIDEAFDAGWLAKVNQVLVALVVDLLESEPISLSGDTD